MSAHVECDECGTCLDSINIDYESCVECCDMLCSDCAEIIGEDAYCIACARRDRDIRNGMLAKEERDVIRAARSKHP